MKVLAHRGTWAKKVERNTKDAFRRSFIQGFGIETDIRDHKGKLVISHDLPENNNSILMFSEFLELYKEVGDDSLILALNIKADGLQEKLKSYLMEYEISSYFVFDMSIPDMLPYKENDILIFTRQSEYEKDLALYSYATGVWLDEFYSHWINEEMINSHIDQGKQICIVSPELHGRDYMKEWLDYKRIIENLDSSRVMICTDYPQKAEVFFNGKKS